MVLDTSALVAIFNCEPERRSFIEAIEAADFVRLSVASLVEASIVIESRYGPEGVVDLERFIARARIQLVSIDAAQANIARFAFRRFGKGRHKAALNYGDCFSYAAAVSLGEPLLYKGQDFIFTDAPLYKVSS